MAEKTYCQVVHADSGRVLVPRARWCDTYASKLRGFMFQRAIGRGEGLVLVEEADSRAATAIHMLFVFCDLGVFWVNAAGQVVDKALARPWRPSYVSQAPARFVVEAAPAVLGQVNRGERVEFVPIPGAAGRRA